jgi:predicted acetyltransferase
MSRTELRQLSADDQPDFQRFLDYAFAPEAGPQEYDDGSTPDRQGQQFGLFDDGTLRSVCTHYDLTASVRGEWVPVAGLAALATMPEHRRQGYVSDLVTASLRRWRGESPLAALWPFDYGYYEQFGWAMGCTLTEYTCPPDALAFGRDAPGTARRLDPADWERLRGVTDAYREEYDLVMRRDESWWRERIFDSGDRYVYGLERDGEICGYVGYTVEAEESRRLKVLYNAFTDHDAFRGLLGFLSNHDSQVEEVTLYRPAESSLLDMVPDPKAVDCEVHPGMMVRVVSVVDALEAVSYPSEATGTLTLAVSDDTADWNDGTFELAVANGEGGCRSVESGDPDVRLDIGTLAQILVGYHSVTEARRLADLQVTSEDVASQLAGWFPPRAVSPLDNF